jgi:hypothetical protein
MNGCCLQGKINVQKFTDIGGDRSLDSLSNDGGRTIADQRPPLGVGDINVDDAHGRMNETGA